MVVFTCNHCGDSVHKPKVEKHYSFKCYGTYKSLTCADCFKDFKEEEYAVHTKCLTEDERYSAKGTFAGGVVLKGEVKQESWNEMIKGFISTEPNLRPPVRNLLNAMDSFSNIPRKKQKFINFIKSSMGGRASMQDIEDVWELIEKHKVEESKKKAENGAPKRKSDGGTDAEPAVKKQKVENGENGDNDETEKFSFKNTILEILNKKTSISCEKLQKKVLKAYKKMMESEATEKTIKKYNKKLSKIDNVVTKDGTVSLVKNEC